MLDTSFFWSAVTTCSLLGMAIGIFVGSFSVSRNADLTGKALMIDAVMWGFTFGLIAGVAGGALGSYLQDREIDAEEYRYVAAFRTTTPEIAAITRSAMSGDGRITKGEFYRIRARIRQETDAADLETARASAAGFERSASPSEGSVRHGREMRRPSSHAP